MTCSSGGVSRSQLNTGRLASVTCSQQQATTLPVQQQGSVYGRISHRLGHRVDTSTYPSLSGQLDGAECGMWHSIVHANRVSCQQHLVTGSCCFHPVVPLAAPNLLSYWLPHVGGFVRVLLVMRCCSDLPGLVDLMVSGIWAIFFLSMGASLLAWGKCKSSSLCMAWDATVGLGFLLWVLYTITAVLAAWDLRDQLMALKETAAAAAAAPGKLDVDWFVRSAFRLVL